MPGTSSVFSMLMAPESLKKTGLPEFGPKDMAVYEALLEAGVQTLSSRLSEAAFVLKKRAKADLFTEKVPQKAP